MIDKTCINCGEKFQVKTELSYVQYCLICYNKTKGPRGVRETKEVKESIAMQAIFKALCENRPATVKISRLIKESQKVYEALFK